MPRITAAVRLAAAANKTVEQVCRDAQCSRRTFERAARRGRACSYLAERLGYAAGCDTKVFLYGLAAFEESGHAGATGRTPDPAPGINAERPAPLRERNDSRRRVRPLKLI